MSAFLVGCVLGAAMVWYLRRAGASRRVGPSAGDRLVREPLVIGVAPSRAERARRLVLREASRDPRVVAATLPQIVARTPRAWGVEIRVDVRVAAGPDEVTSDLRLAIADALAREGIALRPPPPARAASRALGAGGTRRHD